MTAAQRETLEDMASAYGQSDVGDALRAALGTCGNCAHADTIEAPAGSVYCTLPGAWLSARRMPAEARCKDWTAKEGA